MALNRVNDPADQSTVLVSAHDSEGRMVALLSFVPWGPTGPLWMSCAAPRGPNGVVEFMVASPHGAGRFAWRAQGVLEFRDVWADFAAADRVVPRRGIVSLPVPGRAGPFLTAASPVSLQPEVLSALGTPLPCCEPTLALVNVAVAAGVAEGFLPDLSARRSREEHRTLSEGELVLLREMQQVRAEEHPQVPRSQQTQHRLRHPQELRDAGMNPYPIEGEDVTKTHGWDGSVMVLSVPEALNIFSHQNIPEKEYTVSGRVRALRDHGGVLFVTLFEAGKTLQVIP